MDVIATAVFLATLGERLSGVLIKPVLAALVDGKVSEPARVWIYGIACAIPGAGIVLVAGADLFAELGLVLPYPWGIALSALVIGLGSNFVHETVALVRMKRGAYVA